MGIPEFKMVTKEFVIGVPEFAIRDQKLALDLPQFKLVNVEVEKQKKYADEASARGEAMKADMEGQSREFQSQYRATYAPAISASFKCFGDGIRQQREASLTQVNIGIATFTTSILDLRTKGDTQSAQKLEVELKKLEAQRDTIAQQFSEALSKLDDSEKASLAQLGGEKPAGQAMIDLDKAVKAVAKTPAKKPAYIRY